jgi:hypothetical protein
MEAYLREVFPDRPWAEPIAVTADELTETEVIAPPPTREP